jgi:hypothetical protein
MKFETVELELEVETIAALFLEARRQGVSFDHYCNAILDLALKDMEGIDIMDDEDDGA